MNDVRRHPEPGIVIEMSAVSKRFPGTLAVDNVDFSARAGEVHAIMGENGAGKSTLMKTLAGSFDDYTGTIRLGGREVDLRSPAVARRSGIGMVYQELSLAAPVSVAENILAGRLPRRWGGILDRRALFDEARRWLDMVGLDVDPLTEVGELSRHEAQLVEIAKVLSAEPRVLVMDEPTSSLSREEVERLFGIIRSLKNRGLAIIYISHHLPEVFRIADRVTIMRDGRRVDTCAIGDVDSTRLVELMVGGAMSDLYAKRTRAPGPVLFETVGLTRYGFFHKASLQLRRGEILGICGLNGAGRSELARSACGIDPLDDGAVILDGEDITPRDYPAAVRKGLVYLPEDRKNEGLALRLTMGENILSAIIPRHCSCGVYRPGPGRRIVGDMIASLGISPPEPRREMVNFSGGNQQKGLLAKWLASEPKVLILDEPTRGVDVNAKAVIHRAVADIADRGRGVILISSDLPELVGLSDRVLILRQGRIIGEAERARCTEEHLLLAANGEGELLSA